MATALDSDLLQKMATVTNGSYHQAATRPGWRRSPGSIDLRFKIVTEHTEITGLFAAAAILLLVAGALLRCCGSGGWCEVSFTWPLALLLVLAVPWCSASTCWPAAPPQAGGDLFERRPAALRASPPVALAAPRARRPAARPASGCSAVAAARPQLTQTVPIGQTSIILALDVSRSMCSTDVQPNRLSVAQKAAKDFVELQPAGTRMGLVVFAGLGPARRPADDGPQGAGAGHRRPVHRPGHGHRRGHAQGARRHRRGQPAGPSRSATSATSGAACSAGGAGAAAAAQAGYRAATCPTSSCC